MSLRHQIIRLAYMDLHLRPFALSILASDRQAMEFDTQEALDKYKSTHAVRPSTKLTVKKNEVAPSPAPTPVASPGKGKGFPNVSLKADRYKGGEGKKFTFNLTDWDQADSADDIKNVIHAFSEEGLTKEDIADLAGAPILSEIPGAYYVNTLVDEDEPSSLEIDVIGPHIQLMIRRLRTDADGNPYIYNDTLQLWPGAPKGLGTKIFADQVLQARTMGVKNIQCSAYRDRERPEWVGYKVWPKLGYDGPVPFDKPSDPAISEEVAPPLPKQLATKLKEAGFKEPVMVSHLYKVKGGQEWWEKNGVNFHATFDLADDSTSMQVLSEFLRKKAGEAKQEPEDWMTHVASENKGRKGERLHENLDLDESDHKILQAIWETFRK